MNTHDDLRSALQRGASGLGEAQPLTLDDVKGRARGLRRRRAALTGVATVAVVALAVPLGLSFTDSTVSGPEIEPASPTETIQPPGDPTEVLLTTDRPVGAVPPGIDYLYDGEIVPAGSDDTVTIGPGYGGVVPFGEGWLAMSNDGGSIDVVDADGRITGTELAGAPMAVSPDGTVVAYGSRGRVMTLVDGEEPRQLYRGEGSPAPVAVVGWESCDDEATGMGCSVYFNDETSGQAMIAVTTEGITDEVSGVRTMADVSADGRVTGVVSANDSGSCSAMLGLDGKPAWKTCDHTLGEFSPDGSLVIGYPAYRDGAGDASLAILDAESGEVLAEVSRGETSQAFLSGARWDVDSTVLMPVHEDETWALMRFAPDGVLVRAVARDFPGAEPYVSDLSLAVTP